MAHKATPRQRGLQVCAAAAFVGILTSGPLGLIIVSATNPQPAWRDAETFVRAYHPVQALPYFCGFLLIAGMVAVIAALHELSGEDHRVRSTAALVCAGAFTGSHGFTIAGTTPI